MEEELNGLWLQAGGEKIGTFEDFKTDLQSDEEMQKWAWNKFGGEKIGSLDDFKLDFGFTSTKPQSPTDKLKAAQAASNKAMSGMEGITTGITTPKTKKLKVSKANETTQINWADDKITNNITFETEVDDDNIIVDMPKVKTVKSEINTINNEIVDKDSGLLVSTQRPYKSKTINGYSWSSDQPVTTIIAEGQYKTTQEKPTSVFDEKGVEGIAAAKDRSLKKLEKEDELKSTIVMSLKNQDLETYIKQDVYEDFDGSVAGQGGDDRAYNEALLAGVGDVEEDIKYVVDYNSNRLKEKYENYNQYLEESKAANTKEKQDRFYAKYADIINDPLTKEIFELQDKYNELDPYKEQVKTQLFQDPEVLALYQEKEEAKKNKDALREGPITGVEAIDNTIDVIGRNAARLLGRTEKMIGGVVSLADTEIGGKIIRRGEDLEDLNPKDSAYEGLAEEYIVETDDFEIVFEDNNPDSKPLYMRSKDSGRIVPSLGSIENSAVNFNGEVTPISEIIKGANKEKNSNLRVYTSMIADTGLDLIPQILTTKGMGGVLTKVGAGAKAAYGVGAAFSGFAQVKGAALSELNKIKELTQDQRENISTILGAGTAVITSINPLEAKLANGEFSNSIKAYISKNAAAIASGKISPRVMVQEVIGSGLKAGGKEFVEEGVEQKFERDVVNPITNKLYGTSLKEGTTMDEWKTIGAISMTIGLFADVAGNVTFNPKDKYQAQALTEVIANPDIYEAYIDGMRETNPEQAQAINSVIRPIVEEINTLGDNVNQEAKVQIASKMLAATKLEQEISKIKNPVLKKQKENTLNELYKEITEIELGKKAAEGLVEEIEGTPKEGEEVKPPVVEEVDTELATGADSGAGTAAAEAKPPTTNDEIVDVAPEDVTTPTKPEPNKVNVLGQEVNFYNNYIPETVEDVEDNAVYSFSAPTKEGLPEKIRDKAKKGMEGEVNGKKVERWSASIGGAELKALIPETTPTETLVNETPTETVAEEFDEVETISDYSETPVTYKGESGILKKDGQTWTVETPTTIYDLEGVNDDTSLSAAGVQIADKININEDGSFSIRGKEYTNMFSDPMSAVTMNDDGTYTVRLDTKGDTPQPRNFRGQLAEDLAYQITLQKITKEDAKEFEEYINNADANGEIPSPATEATTRTDAEVPSAKKQRVKSAPQATQKSQPTQSAAPTEKVAPAQSKQATEPNNIITTTLPGGNISGQFIKQDGKWYKAKKDGTASKTEIKKPEYVAALDSVQENSQFMEREQGVVSEQVDIEAKKANIEKRNTYTRETQEQVLPKGTPIFGGAFADGITKYINDNLGLEVGDKITFFSEKERTGVWNGTRIIEDNTNNPWGLQGLLMNTNDWVRNQTKYDAELKALEEQAPAQTDGKTEQLPNIPAPQLVKELDAAEKKILELSKEYPKASNNRKKEIQKEVQDIRNRYKFSILGEKGAASLDAVEEANIRLNNLTVAKEMEAAGKDAKAIKLATGWEKGADGKYRLEVGDGKMKQGVDLTKEGLTLGDIYVNEELFKAYPQLSSIPVRLINFAPDIDGGFNMAENTIDLNINNIEDALYRRELPKTLEHETTHIVQQIEGFNRGGNQQEFLRAIYGRLNGDTSGDGEYVNGAEETPEFKRAFERAIGGTFKREFDELVKEKNTNRRDIYARKMAKDMYDELAGEIEARSVEKRMGMSPEQRRQSLLDATASVAKEDRIVIIDAFNNTALSKKGANDIDFDSILSNLRDLKQKVSNGGVDTSSVPTKNTIETVLENLGEELDAAGKPKKKRPAKEVRQTIVDQIKKFFVKDLKDITPEQATKLAEANFTMWEAVANTLSGTKGLQAAIDYMRSKVAQIGVIATADEARTMGSSKFQIIGEKGAAALDAAEEATTRLDNLAVAREMEASPIAARLLEKARKLIFDKVDSDKSLPLRSYLDFEQILRRTDADIEYTVNLDSSLDINLNGDKITVKTDADLLKFFDALGVDNDFLLSVMKRTYDDKFDSRRVKLATGWERGSSDINKIINQLETQGKIKKVPCKK